MKSINKWIGIGRLTRDAEIKTTQSGTQIARFSIAVSGSEKQGEQWVDRPDFIDCVVFGRTADVVQKYTAKGKEVAIEGRLKHERWQDKDGKNQSKLNVIVDSLQLLGGSEKNNQAGYEDENIPM